MMTRGLLAATTALIVTMLTSGSLRADPELPAVVAKSIAESKAACAPDPVKLSPGFQSKKDVNGDGIPDYILDYSKYQCGDMSSFFCGSAGCLTQVFVSTNGSFAKVLDENVQTIKFTKVGQRPAIVLGEHGSACGRSGSAACGSTLIWSGSAFVRKK